MIDTKHLLTVGVDDETRSIYDTYVDELNQRIVISPENAKSALKSLMNVLISLEENQDVKPGYDSLPSFFITHRVMYMTFVDYLMRQGHSTQEIDGLLFHERAVDVTDTPAFFDFFRDLMLTIFPIFNPFLEAEDDVERFSRPVRKYANFLKEKNDVPNMIRFIQQYAGFCDELYLVGYRKANDGWGGRLDLDTTVYPMFFRKIICEAVENDGFSDHVIDFLYDRTKEVGEPDTALIDVYIFSMALRENKKFLSAIQKADAVLKKEIDKTLGLIEKQKGEKLSAAASFKVIRELTAYEELEGIIYFFFDEKRLRKIMDDTGHEAHVESTLNLVRSWPPKIRHFVMYALGKLLLAPDTTVKATPDVIEMFCNQIRADVETMYSEAVMNSLPAQYRERIPDLEIRFFLNRIFTNTTTLDGFEAVQEQFRRFLVDQSGFPLIHEIFIERASEKRHASALMSFYIASLLTQQLGDVMPDAIIRLMAGRLSLTYSFTRRLNLYREIWKLRYEYDGTHNGRETVYYNGFDRQNWDVPEKEKSTPLKDRPIDEQWIILYHVINNRELAWALTLLDEELLFPEVKNSPDPVAALEAARMELRGKVYQIIDSKFLDLLSDAEELAKREAEKRSEFPVAYYGKYEKIRSILIAQFIASGWDVEVAELKRKGRRPVIKMGQNELLRGIKNIDAQRILEQYEYKEARENIDIGQLRKQVETREQLLSFINTMAKREVQMLQKLYGLSDEALALVSYTSTKIRSNELRVEQGIRQLVERLKGDLGWQSAKEPLALDTICGNCFAGRYGKMDVKIIKKDKNGKPIIDPETGEEAEKTYTVTPEKFPEFLEPYRKEILALDKDALYRVFYAITLQSIVAETFGSMTFIKEALATNKYVIAADGLKEQAIENQEILEYARLKYDMMNQLAPFEIHMN